MVSTRLLRCLLFALLAAAVGGALLLALLAIDTSLSVWQRLQGLPAGFGYLYGALLGAAGLGVAWLGWRLLRRRRPRRRPPPPPVTRADIERRAQRLVEVGATAPAVADELAELDRRAGSGHVWVVVFGAVNAGKSALVRALAPQATTASDALAGTTRAVEHVHGALPDGRPLVLADVPGTQEDPGRETLAREEVLRAHWVLYVCAGDLSRSQAAEVDWLKAFGKPFALVLNQADRYRPEELAQLQRRLRERVDAPLVTVSAGGEEAVEQDGTLAWRQRPPEVAPLQALLARRLAAGPQALEAARSQAVLGGLDARLSAVETADRAARCEAAVGKYTRRAVVGALAAVAPGSDLVIQGALATGLVRELAAIHEVPVRQIDIDALVARATGTLRTTTAVVLAIAGNAAKAFPGLGTLGGGVAHAVAYGMIFDSLGRAVAATLAESGRLDAQAAVDAFADTLRATPRPPVLGLLGAVLAERVVDRAKAREESRP
ncbi:MAG: 50S ribosome-binding GTPase [Xanthomonadales bacterium]|nr:50S ribosome-binding GTPase [Xanthomonadales bacterium]